MRRRAITSPWRSRCSGRSEQPPRRLVGRVVASAKAERLRYTPSVLPAAAPRAEYERRLAAWRERIAALDRINFTISNIRLAIAAGRRRPAVDGVRATRRSRRRGRSPRGSRSARSRSCTPSGCSGSSAPAPPSASTCAASIGWPAAGRAPAATASAFLDGHPYARRSRSVRTGLAVRAAQHDADRSRRD